MRDLRLIWSRCLNPILKWKNRGRSHHGLTDLTSCLELSWTAIGQDEAYKPSSFVIRGQTWPYGRVGSVCRVDPCKISNGDFTKYGQPVPRPDPTWGVGIAHYQLWGWRYPSCAQTVPFFSVWIYLPNTWSNQPNQSERLIYAPLAWITTDSGKGLVSSLCQAVAWTNFDL